MNRATLLPVVLLSTAVGASAGQYSHGRSHGFVRSSVVAHVAAHAPVRPASGPASFTPPVARNTAFHAPMITPPTARAVIRTPVNQINRAPAASRGTASSFRGRTSFAQMNAGRRVMRRDGSGTGGTGTGTTTADEPAMPIVEGQLIRTEGLGAIVSQPSEGPRLHAVEAGTSIALDPSKAVAVTGRGTFIGPRDTPPPPNPVSGNTASRGNSITERTDTTNSASANATSESSSSGGWTPPGQLKKQDNGN